MITLWDKSPCRKTKNANDLARHPKTVHVNYPAGANESDARSWREKRMTVIWFARALESPSSSPQERKREIEASGIARQTNPSDDFETLTSERVYLLCVASKAGDFFPPFFFLFFPSLSVSLSLSLSLAYSRENDQTGRDILLRGFNERLSPFVNYELFSDPWSQRWRGDCCPVVNRWSCWRDAWMTGGSLRHSHLALYVTKEKWRHTCPVYAFRPVKARPYIYIYTFHFLSTNWLSCFTTQQILWHRVENERSQGDLSVVSSQWNKESFFPIGSAEERTEQCGVCRARARFLGNASRCSLRARSNKGTGSANTSD